MKTNQLKNEFLINLDNNEMTFNEMKISSKDYCLWKCSKCGYEWKTQFKSRAGQDRGCKECNKIAQAQRVINRCIYKNGTLQEKRPDLLDEWDWKENTKIKLYPDKLSVKCETKANWICRECGYKYLAKIVKRAVNNTSCPKCTGKVIEQDNSIVAKVPEIIEYLNDEFTYETAIKTAPNSHKNIVLTCPICKNKFSTKPYIFIKGHRCPFCSGYIATPTHNLKTEFPEIAELFLEQKNNVKATQVSPHSNKKYYFSCGVCGSPTIKQVDKAVCRGVLCKKCSARYHTSFPEQAIFFYAKKYFGDNVENRYLINNRKDGEIDVYMPELKIGIEYDSDYHHKDKEISDNRKNQLAEKRNINLIRITEFPKKQQNTINVSKRANDEELSNAIISAFIMINSSLNYDINVHRDRALIMEYLYTSPIKNNIAKLFPKCVNDWDYDKNGCLKPEFFTKGSNQSVYWKNPNGSSSLRRIATQIRKYQKKN